MKLCRAFIADKTIDERPVPDRHFPQPVPSADPCTSSSSVATPSVTATAATTNTAKIGRLGLSLAMHLCQVIGLILVMSVIYLLFGSYYRYVVSAKQAFDW